MPRPSGILLCILWVLLNGAIPSAFADQMRDEAAPALLLLYRAANGGEQPLGITPNQPVGCIKSPGQRTSPEKPGHSTYEHLIRVLVPFGAAALALGGIHDQNLDYTGTNLQTNFGHQMVRATVSNLSRCVDEVTAALLGEYHPDGVILPELAAEGAIAVLMLGLGGVQSVGDKTHLGVDKAIRFFAQTQTVNSGHLVLGEVSGQILDRLVDLPPRTQKIVTAALSGVATGSLYYQLTALYGDRSNTGDLHVKISDAALLGVSAATIPFLEDFVSLATDNPLWKHLGVHSILEAVSLTGAASLYALVSYYPVDQRTNSIYLARLLAASFGKLAGLSAVEIMGNKTINMLYADKDQKRTILSRPALKAIAYLSITLFTNEVYRRYGIMSHTPLREALMYFRNGVYIAAITNGVSGLLSDFVQTVEQPQSVTRQ